MKTVVVKSHMRTDGTTVKSHIRNPFAKKKMSTRKKAAIAGGAAIGAGAAGYAGYKGTKHYLLGRSLGMGRGKAAKFAASGLKGNIVSGVRELGRKFKK